ncbi:MAG: replication protein [Candidatus Omnitrophica bacterium]|nr:replication protein [Candidatus Omnitrophota bacterium]
MEQNYSQPGGGYTKINNNVLEELYKSPFNGTQIRAILVISRMTWGFHKDSRSFSYGWLAKAANLDKRNLRRAISLLVQANVIIKDKTGRWNKFAINQAHTSWELWKTHGNKRAKSSLHKGQGNP